MDSRGDPREQTTREVEELARLRTIEARARYWDRLYEHHYREILDSDDEIGRHGVIAEMLTRFAAGGVVIDAGCGTGVLADLIDRNRFRYRGIDIAPSAIEIAVSKQAPNATFEVAALETYRGEDRADVIVLNEIAYYLPDEEVDAFVKANLIRDGIVIFSNFDFPAGAALSERWMRTRTMLALVNVANPARGFMWRIGAFKSD